MAATQQVTALVRSVKPAADQDEATMTAQYVRLSLFVLVVLLGASIAWATFVHRGGAWEGSISDYFHTPARLAVVATMVAIGVGLMVLYSGNRVENALLNVAGAFAPIIGFAATTQAAGSTGPVDFDVPTNDVDAFARTSLPAYFAALVLLACCVYFVHPTETRRRSFLSTVVAILGLALVTSITWEIDRRTVHVLAALGFFLPLIVLVFATSLAPGIPFKKRYRSIGYLMVGAVIWYAIDRRSVRAEHATFFVETVLVGCFAAFWLMEYIRIAPRARRQGSGAAGIG